MEDNGDDGMEARVAGDGDEDDTDDDVWEVKDGEEDETERDDSELGGYEAIFLEFSRFSASSFLHDYGESCPHPCLFSRFYLSFVVGPLTLKRLRIPRLLSPPL
ncbi:hypothetical protein CRG98_032055 [Punica granatum]|uniref:Uncharacterized protein n=1 Tax=Punica granatum TaxID=22663 RepID=A0A2I0IU94_PUNGR|nr:hypothetical protein CRG98_032055 [Punica granatum]